MENKYLRILKEAISSAVPGKYFFYDFYGDLISPFDYFEDYFKEKENPLEEITLYDLKKEIKYYLISIPDEDIAFLFNYYFTRRNPLRNTKGEINLPLINGEIEEYITSLNKEYGKKKILFQNFGSGYQRWEKVFHTELKENEKDLLTILAFNERVMKESGCLFIQKRNDYFKKRRDHLYTSECQIVDTKGEFLLSSNDGSRLFDGCRCTENIPFVWWKDEKGNDYYKVYSPINEEKIPRFDLFEMPLKPENDTVYFFILKRNISLTKKLLRIAKENYLLCCISLTRSTLMGIEFPKYIENENGFDYILKECRHSFGIKKTPGSITIPLKITTNVYFPPQSVDSALIYYLIQTNFLFYHFFYQEGRRPYAEDPGMCISYKGIKKTSYSDEFSTSNYVGSSLKFQILGNVMIEGETLLEVSIKKAAGELELTCFIDELTCLLKYYSQNYLRIKDVIGTYVNNISLDFLESEEGEEITTNILYIKKLNQIAANTGEMYNGASKKVQCLKQPIFVKERDVADWENLKLKDGSKRKVLIFPPEEGRDILPESEKALPENTVYRWVCPDDEFPHPRLFSNAGSELYPYLPICQTNEMSEEEKVILQTWYSRKTTEKSDFQLSENIIKTDKIRRFSEIAELSLDLSNYLRLVFNNFYSNFVRMGTDVGETSFISATLMCSDVFRRVKDETLRNKICNYYRDELKGYYTVMRQELYNESESDVISLLDDPTFSVDSALFFRGLEEILKLNIYVFIYEGGKINFEVPRNQLYHIRLHNPERKTILLFKHLGIDSDALSEYHYEYILTLPSDLDDYVLSEKGEKKDIPFSFGEKIYNSFISAQQFITFSRKASLYTGAGSTPSPQDESPDRKKEVECRINSYNKINWRDILRNRNIHSQYIDAFGKCRILNVEINLGGDGSPSVKKKQKEIAEKIIVSFFIPPSPPLEVEVENKIYPLKREHETLALSNFEEEPTGINESGIFFKILDFKGGVFIPFERVKIENDFFNYKNTKRSSNILRETIVWCWRCDALKLSAEEWTKKFLVPDKSDETRPNFEKVTLTFPMIKNVNSVSAIESISEWWPSVFRNSSGSKNGWKVHLPLGVYSVMKKYLLTLDADTEGLPNNPERYLISEIRNSFAIKDENIILFGLENYRNYISSITKKTVANVNSVVDFSLPFPQLISFPAGVYIVQSVIDDTLENAVKVCEDWSQSGVNTFLITDTLVREKVPFGIVVQTSDGRIVPQQDFTSGKEEYHLVLFNQSKYYAMLKLL